MNGEGSMENDTLETGINQKLMDMEFMNGKMEISI